MKVHLLKEKTIREFAETHATDKKAFEDWLYKIKNSDWEKPTDIKKTFPTADLLGKNSNRVVFDVRGGSYRIICEYNFADTMNHLYVNFIDKHEEYTKLCDKDEQYTVDKY